MIAAVDALVATYPPATTPTKDFLQARHDTGLAWVWFPERHHGVRVRGRLSR
jgi:hypothetical protein